MHVLRLVRRPAASISLCKKCVFCLRPYSSATPSFSKSLDVQLPPESSTTSAKIDSWTPPMITEKFDKGPKLSDEAKELIKKIPQQIKDASRLMAQNKKDEANQILENMGSEFLNCTSKKERPFALDAMQTASALWTIIGSTSEVLEDPLQAAIDFATLLVQLHLAKMDDIWMRIFREPDPSAALKIYEDLVRLFPYVKLFPESMFIILKSFVMQGKWREFEEALNVIPKETPRKAMCGAIMLSEGRAIEYLDRLKCGNEKLSIDQVNYICTIAYATKEASILEPLVQLYRQLPNHQPTRHLCYNTLALIYLKKSDSESIELLWRSLKKQIPPGERFEYRHVFQRCRHFYRVNNLKPPKDLMVILEKCQIEKM